MKMASFCSRMGRFQIFLLLSPMSNDQAIDVEYEAEELPAQTASSKLVQVKILME